MTSTPEEPVVRQSRIRVPPDTLYKYFTDRELLLKWMGVDAQIDLKPGGLFRVNVTGRDILQAEYKEIVPNEKLVFSWGWEAPGHPLPPGSSRVEITFTPQGEVTIVRIAHYGLPKAEELNQAYGWQHYLGRLGMAAIGREPVPDPWVVPEEQRKSL